MHQATEDTYQMSTSRWFALVVEEDHSLDIDRIEWNGDATPDLITLPGGRMLIKVGRYLSQGDRYRYREPTQLVMNAGGGRLSTGEDGA
jgi:hypothetical protein